MEFLFERKGVFVLNTENLEIEAEELELELIDGGATDIDKEEDLISVYTEFKDFGKMSTKLENLNIEPKNAEVQRIPMNTMELPLEDAKKMMNLIEKFEDDDDVQNVYHNLEITDELIESLEDE